MIERHMREQDENDTIASNENVMLGLLAACEPVKRGSRWVMRCPFHADAHPSGSLWRSGSGAWRFGCFPCGINLDVFSLAMRLDGIGFREARRRLLGGEFVPAAPLPAPAPARGKGKPMVIACEVSGCGRREDVEWIEVAMGLDSGRCKGGLISELGGVVEWLCPSCESKLSRTDGQPMNSSGDAVDDASAPHGLAQTNTASGAGPDVGARKPDQIPPPTS